MFGSHLPESKDASLREARQALGEARTSLQIIGEKLQAARGSRELTAARKIIREAIAHVDAAHGYLDAVYDSHRSLGRQIRSKKEPAA